MSESAAHPRGTDLVALFLDTVDTLRPPTPAVVVEHPDQLWVPASASLLRELLGGLVRVAVSDAAERAEIRLELGARPGCTFFLRDNGEAVTRDACAVHQAADTLLKSVGGQMQIHAERGWGSTVAVVLPPSSTDDAASSTS